MEEYLFQNCQKLVVFHPEKDAVLLAQRQGEDDFDEVYSFIGGKMERRDDTLVDGIRREKNEEIGRDATLAVNPETAVIEMYWKNSGTPMILPHYYAEYINGDIRLGDEYAAYEWVPVENVDSFEPVIGTVPGVVEKMRRLKPVLGEEDLVTV